MKNGFFSAKMTTMKSGVQTSNTQLSIPDFFKVLIPLGLMGLLIFYFHIEMEIRLIGIMPLVVFGFVLYAFLPQALRLPFLFTLNILAIFRLLGSFDGAVLTGFGMALFALANIPVAVRYRIMAALFAGVLMFLFRADWLPLVSGRVVLPILGSMFMFRMVLYLYEMQFEKEAAGFWKKINYFFLLPNLVFVIFPVVDYSTFVRNYYSKPAFETYRRGILMMGNGIFHLLLYRLIYYYLVPAPSEVQDTYTLLQYMITSYALIVRLAGIFHFSVGVICLFGFNLPHAFEHYFFANNFSDLWRRINIYWRDFVTKVFYFPIYFKLKHLGPTKGLFFSVMIVFFINWFLHGYQWFWIRGSFPLTIQDTSFWAILGVAVAINSVIQSKSKPVRRNPNVFSQKAAWNRSFSVLGIFLFMSALWSYWVSYTVADWAATVQRGLPSSAAELLLPAMGVIVLAGLGVLLQYFNFKYYSKQFRLKPSLARTYWGSTLGMALLLLFALPAINKPLAEHFQLDFEPVLYTKLNEADQMQLYKGYYETLIVSNNLSSRIWELEQAKPDDWRNFNTLGVTERRDDIRLKDLLPNISVPFKGALLTTNSHGLRDREYMLPKPDNTLRIALLGGSIEMGTGVNTDQTFENLFEDYLNQNSELVGGRQVEILNFALAGNHLFQNAAIFLEKVPDFNPDLVFYVAHSNEQRRMLGSSIYRTVSSGRNLVFPELKRIVDEAGVNEHTPEQEFITRLADREFEITLMGYNLILEQARQLNALPVWLFISTLDDEHFEDDEVLAKKVSEMGFLKLNLAQWHKGHNSETLRLAPWDAHPNVVGHRLMADELIEQLLQSPTLLQYLNEQGMK